MFTFFDPMHAAVHILLESTGQYSYRDETQVKTVLEDTESPIRNKYIEKLYDQVISKSHIDFDNIPQSKGNIVQYSGYTNMIEVLENILKLASDNHAQNVIDYVQTIKVAIANMRKLAPVYQKGFSTRNDYIMLEYNTFVYTIIQATSSLLYEFVDYIKKPNQQTIEIVLKNNKYKANIYYIEQLNKFNMVNKNMQYEKYLQAMLQNGRDNFLGTAEIVGLTTVISLALIIVPLVRELVYQFYNVRSNISDAMAQQAYFLEMNKAVIEANNDFNQKKKTEILIKQEKIKNLCLRISDKLRVNHIKAIDSGKAAIQNDNKLLTLDGIKKEISTSELNLF